MKKTAIIITIAIAALCLMPFALYYGCLFFAHDCNPDFLKIDACLDAGGKWDYEKRVGIYPHKQTDNKHKQTSANIPAQEPLPAELQTPDGIDDYFNLIKDHFNDNKFDDIYAMYADWTKTKLTAKENKKALALRQKQYGKILNGTFSHYQVKRWEVYKIFILYYQVKTTKLNGYFIIRLIENKDGGLGLWGTSLTKEQQ